MKIFFDTEFSGLHQQTTLMSIGAITGDGKTFYAELNDYDKSQIDDWLRENVISNFTNENVISSPECAAQIESFISQYESVEMWSDCLSYDWVLFNQLWGHAFNLPKKIHYIPLDICTVFKMNNIDPDVDREKYSGMSKNAKKHNALWDARVIKACYEKLTEQNRIG